MPLILRVSQINEQSSASQNGPDASDAAGLPEISRGLTADERAALPPFSWIRAFEAVVTCGGIRKASAALSVDHAAISRHIRSLEQWAGVALFDRSPGAGGQLNPAGRQYYVSIVRGLTDIARGGIGLRWRTDSHKLSLCCVPGLASEWLTGRLGDFATKHPDIAIELQPVEADPDPGNALVDLFIHYVLDIKKVELDSALRSTELARPPILAVASPSLLNTLPVPSTPADLLDMPLLHEASFDQWRRWLAGHGIESEGRLSGTKLWQGHLTLAAARRGQGVALANALLVSDDLASGVLVEVGKWPPIYLGTYMLTGRRQHWRDGTIESFRRWLHAMFERESWKV